MNSRFRSVTKPVLRLLTMMITLATGFAFGQQATSLKAINQLPLQLLGKPMSSFVTSLGKRLQTPGLERSVLVGTISTPSSSNLAIAVTRENPGRIRIVEGVGAAQVVSIVDQQSQMATSAMAQDRLNLVETLLFDAQEYLLFDHANFGGTRFLGQAFTYPRAAASERFSVFDHLNNVGLLEPGTTRAKRFYLNVVTGLLEYVVTSEGSAGLTETGITWQTVGTEQFPASITQWKNGAQVFAIQFAQASVGPTVADSTFSQ